MVRIPDLALTIQVIVLGGFQLLELITGIPWLVRFQLVRFLIQCGLQTTLNIAIFQLSAVLEQILFVKKNPLQDFLSSLNAVISTNERH